MRPIRVVTTNAGKFDEIRRLLADGGIASTWVRRSLPEIQADSLREVAAAKLADLRGEPGPLLVEDSGLFIESLGGFPGVYSAPVLRMLGLRPIVELLARRDRTAEYRAVVGLLDGRRARWFEGSCRGSIAKRLRGTGGFGYDPIFVPRGSRRTFAELSTSEKNELSHRGDAIRSMVRALRR